MYCLNDFEEDESGEITYKGLTTSTPIQHTETSGERSQARVTVSDSKNYPNRSRAFPEEMQEPATDNEGSGEGSPAQLSCLQDVDNWAILTSLQSSINNVASYLTSEQCTKELILTSF